MADDFAAFGPRVTQIRKARGWTLRELTRAAGVSPSTTHRAERGSDVNLSSALAIARALGASLGDLLKPHDCERCLDSPPPGYACNACGKTSST